MLVRLLSSRCTSMVMQALCLLAASGAVSAGSGDFPSYRNLAAQVEALAEQSGISLVGLSRLEDVPAKPVTGTSSQQLSELLGAYNYVMAENKLIVLGKKRWVPPPPRDTILKTRRAGRHHVVDVTLLGLGKTELRTALMIDTGASVIVLPMSMADGLGLSQDALAVRMVQTAKGKVQAKFGVLTAVRLGNQKIADVEVAFIQDALLGANGLLGMNVLGLYRMTLDDQRDQLTLTPRD